jgi:long-chain acyl-CoA synthetase
MAPREAARLIKRVDVSVVISSRRHGRWLSQALGEVDEVRTFYAGYDEGGAFEIEGGGSGVCEVDNVNKDVALMVPTSGTTGEPKVVMLTNEQLITNMAVYRLLMGFHERNVVYCCLSFHHIYCICAQILTHIGLGDTFLIKRKPFFIKDFLASAQAYKITATAFVPYMAILLAEFARPEVFDVSSLRYVTLSGAKTPEAIYRHLIHKYPWVHFVNTYGMSEAGSRISIAAPVWCGFPHDSVGKPMPSVCVRIVNDEGKEVAAGARGQILVKSPGVMKGYYKQPELTARTLRDGWLATGDLGQVDKEGNLYILGRTKDIIITGGENICPQEIEEALVEHPAIRECAVVGQEDRLLGEVPYAFVVANSNCEVPSCAEIVKFCRPKLSSHKIPRYMRFVDELPKLGSWKIDRTALKEMACSSEHAASR